MDYFDPFDFINFLLDGTTIQESNNINFAYFNDAALQQADARRRRRWSASRAIARYGNLDVDLMRNAAPWAPFSTPNDRR